MLLRLNISNFAVFERESISFDGGFNVFTGETGAGKSVLIEAIFLLLGERASKDFIRKGKSSSVIEGVFDVFGNAKLDMVLKENDMEIDGNDFLIISREILENGKSINKINNRVVTLGIIKEIGSYLIDIYGQFGNANLFKKEHHIILLDGMAAKELKPLCDKYSSLYVNYKKTSEKIVFIEEKLINKKSKLEQLQYELDEIDEADIKENEEEILLKEIKRISNMQSIKTALYEADNIINKSDNSAINHLNDAYALLDKVEKYDENISTLIPKLELILEDLQEFIYNLIDYSDNLEMDDERFTIIENRVSEINRLKRKYGYTIEKILEYRSIVQAELDVLLKAEENFKILTQEKNKILKELKLYTNKISALRKNAAERLEKEILKELYDLNMKNIMFKVNIIQKCEFSPDGTDSVEFLISTNMGSDLNSVQKVVSGGEASRIMLAIKKLSSDIDNVQTLVFDEIDTGISGKTSQMAGLKMKYISQKHQVICITHSPQIASITKNHFFIEKKVLDSNTYSFVEKLNDEKKVCEIARLLSGMNVTEKSLDNARELIEISNKF